MANIVRRDIMDLLLRNVWEIEREANVGAITLACGAVACKREGTSPGKDNVPICRIGPKALRTVKRESAGLAQRTVAACHAGTRPGKQT